jgi:hypothetical protein
MIKALPKLVPKINIYFLLKRTQKIDSIGKPIDFLCLLILDHFQNLRRKSLFFRLIDLLAIKNNLRRSFFEQLNKIAKLVQIILTQSFLIQNQLPLFNQLNNLILLLNSLHEEKE